MASQPSAAAEWDAEVAGGAFESFYSFGNRMLCEIYPSKAGSNSCDEMNSVRGGVHIAYGVRRGRVRCMAIARRPVGRSARRLRSYIPLAGLR